MSEMWYVKGLKGNELKNTLREFLYKYRYTVLESKFIYRVYLDHDYLILTDGIMHGIADLLGVFILLPEKVSKLKIAWFKPEKYGYKELYFSLEDRFDHDVEENESDLGELIGKEDD